MPEESRTPGSIRFGPFELLPETQELRKHGLPVKLSGQPIQVLLVLIACPGRLVTREELQQKLWPGHGFGDLGHGLNAAVNKVREKLGDSATEPKYVETLPGRGYRFIGTVESASGLQEVAGDVFPVVPDVVSPRRWYSPVSPVWSSRLVWGVLAVVAVVLGVSVYWFSQIRPPIHSIAVLPFTASGGANTEFLSDGITDSLIDSVSQLPQVKVISHSSAFHYKGKEVDPKTVGNELGVGALLIGSVVSHGDMLSVTVELVNAHDNTHLWGAQYTRKVSDLVAVQGEISQEIGEQLRLNLSGDQKRRLKALASENSDAYQSYLLSRYYWFKRTPEDYETSRRYLEQAIEKDPTFAPSYAGLAAYYLQLADTGGGSPPEYFAKAKPLLLKALTLDPDLGLGHGLLGFIVLCERDFTKAAYEFKRALELSPNTPESYGGYSIYLRAVGQPDEAVATQKHSRDLDPLSVAMNTMLGWTLYYAHRYPEAIEQFRTSLGMDPASLNAQQGLAYAYQQSGMEKETIAAWQTFLTTSGNSDFANQLGEIYKVSGFQAAMHSFWQAALVANSETAKDTYVSPMVFAGLQARLENKDEAFAWLEKAYAEQSTKLLDLKVDPDFEILRADPRYADLVRRIGLP